MPRPTGERARAACRDNYNLGKASGPCFVLGWDGYTLGYRKTAAYINAEETAPFNHKKVYRHMKALKLLQPKNIRKPKLKKTDWNLISQSDLDAIPFRPNHRSKKQRPLCLRIRPIVLRLLLECGGPFWKRYHSPFCAASLNKKESKLMYNFPKRIQATPSGGMTQFTQGFFLYLTNTFPGHVVNTTHFL